MRTKDRTQGRRSCQQQVRAADVRSLAESWLVTALQCDLHGSRCTTSMFFRVLFWAASRMASVTAACCNLAEAPCHQTIRDAIRRLLPKRFRTLETRLHAAFTTHLPRSLRRGARVLAIDWHSIPYHGHPHKRDDELRRSKPEQGTTTFHVYATACLVHHGERFTVALTHVAKNDTNHTVLTRLLQQIQELSLRIQVVLMDRQFATAAVIALLQKQNIPFVMPAVLRGRPPENPRHATGLRALKRSAKPGWYSHTQKHGTTTVSYSVCVAWRTALHPRKKTRRRKVLLFVCWKIRRPPAEIRELYRRRFGIESSYRQLKQARIRTSTRDPLVRLFYVALALILRNVWVWLHLMKLADRPGYPETVQLARLTLIRLLTLLAHSDGGPEIASDG